MPPPPGPQADRLVLGIAQRLAAILHPTPSRSFASF